MSARESELWCHFREEPVPITWWDAPERYLPHRTRHGEHRTKSCDCIGKEKDRRSWMRRDGGSEGTGQGDNSSTARLRIHRHGGTKESGEAIELKEFIARAAMSKTDIGFSNRDRYQELRSLRLGA